MKTVNNNGIISFLINQGLSDQSTLENANLEAQKNKVSLIHYLTAQGIVNSKQFALKSAHFFGISTFDLEAYNVDFIPKKHINERIMLTHLCLPLYHNKDKLLLAIANPLDLAPVREYRFFTGLNIEYTLVDTLLLKQLVDAAIQKLSTSSLQSFREEDLADIALDIVDTNLQDDDSSIDDDDAPIIKFINKMIVDAINKNASDLHFEPYEKFYRIRYRIDGMLQEIARPPVKLASRISARLKIMSQLDIAERRVPQDGRFKLKVSRNASIDFRVNTCPTTFGEKIVLRILDPSATQIGIEKLGFEDHQRHLYEKALKQSQGMIIVTGPTGSGKTVTLYTGLNMINTTDKNISTAEDPVEINVEGVNQVHINNKQGLTFASALKAFLRQDPDIIMVGEIRDLETGEIAIKAAQTGHLVLSTLHTNSAPETLNRMVDMGIPHYNIATAVSLIIAQRLVRKLCDNCKIANDSITPQNMLELGFTAEQVATNPTLYVHNPKGCNKCFAGYKGRIGVYEVMPITPAISKIILQGGNTIQIAEQAQKDGVNNVYQSALLKVLKGLTSIEEVNRVAIA